MLKSSLSGFSDACILASGTLSVATQPQKMLLQIIAMKK